MAGRGPTPKKDRLRRNMPAIPEEARVVALVAPEAPKGLLKITREWWQGFFTSKLAMLVQETDLPTLRRLAYLYDERERARRALRKRESPISFGPQGQEVLHPLVRYLDQCDKEIRQLEDRFGLSPRSRLSVGVDLINAKRRVEEIWSRGDDDEQEAPPIVDIAGRAPRT